MLTEAEWLAQLPTVYAAAAALFTDQAGRVLLVKPNYRDYWSLPGGMLEDGEPPHVGCAREVAEEIGLTITPGRLLAISWMAPEGARVKPVMHFVFDGGMLSEEQIEQIVLQEEELDDYRFTTALDEHLSPSSAARVTTALRTRASTGPSAYVTYELSSGSCPWE
jgi:8-oxo-dGTP diphosphatase